MSDDNIPEPFIRHSRSSGLTKPWEPLYSHQEGDVVIIGLRAGEAHANSRGFVHGALLTALADNAMGLSLTNARANGNSMVTVNLAIDFVATARLGQWIEIRPVVLKAGKTLGFASAEVRADGKLCARANATFLSAA